MSHITPRIPFTLLLRAPGLAVLTLGLLCAMLAYTSPAQAIGAFKPSKQDLAMLPAYCGPRAEKWGNDTSRPEVAHWVRVFGSDYMHMHHYCITLQAINQASFTMDEKKRRAAYKRAMNNLKYMEGRVSPDFVLWPEMRLYRMRIEQGLRK